MAAVTTTQRTAPSRWWAVLALGPALSALRDLTADPPIYPLALDVLLLVGSLASALVVLAWPRRTP